MPSIATLRLGSGLVLLAFVLGHLLNHAAGIVSVAAMNDLLWLSIAPWRTIPGTVLLVGAALVHAAIALWMLWHRRSLRLHGWEVAQYALGFLIPALLAQHVLGTRTAVEALGVRTDYAYVLYALWVAKPLSGALQVATLIVVWAHAMVGLHFWLRVRPWYGALAPWGLAAAVLIPALALAGYVSGGLEVRALAADPAWVAALGARANLRPEVQPFVDRGTTIAQLVWLGAILAVLAARGGRSLWRRRAGRPRLIYRDGRVVEIPPGGNGRLEAKSMRSLGDSPRAVLQRPRPLRRPAWAPGRRMGGAPCRRRKARGEVAGAGFGGPRAVRLACQNPPVALNGGEPLLPPTPVSRVGVTAAAWLAGEEREIAVLFADMRGFTRLATSGCPMIRSSCSTGGSPCWPAPGRGERRPATTSSVGDGVMALLRGGARARRSGGGGMRLDSPRGWSAGLDGAETRAWAAELPLPAENRDRPPCRAGDSSAGDGLGRAKGADRDRRRGNPTRASRLETLEKELSTAQLACCPMPFGAQPPIAGGPPGLTRHETPIPRQRAPVRSQSMRQPTPAAGRSA